MPSHRANRRCISGFTLVEVGITVAILALAAAVIIPGLHNISKAELRSTASGLAAAVRSAYDSAALSGQTYRLVFSPSLHALSIESTEQTLSFDSRAGAFTTAAQAASYRRRSATTGRVTR